MKCNQVTTTGRVTNLASLYDLPARLSLFHEAARVVYKLVNRLCNVQMHDLL